MGRLSVLLDVARVLDVDVADLTGRPWQYAPSGGPDVASLDELRRVFTQYDRILG